MKKFIMLFAAVLFTAGMFGQNYGILVNDKTYFAGEPAGQFEGFTQYLSHVPLKAGDKCQLYDATNKAGWAVDINTASVSGITREGDHYNVTVEGCFDFYIKLKYQQDELYVGPGSNCGDGEDIGGDPGPGPGPGGDDDDINYYAIGWINGADAGEAAYDVYDDNYLFKDGKLTIDCKMGSYIAVKDHMCNYYYSRTETTIANTQVTLDWANGWSGGQKWAIPEGVNYIIIRSASYKGSIQLERVDKATYDAYHWGNNQGIDNTKVMPKGGKIIVDGELRIVHGDKVFDATGRQL